MKKIINNKVYDTTTARKIGTWCSPELPNDIQYTEETLYRKKNGEYFLHGSGGPASVYRVAAALDGFISGEKILPLSFDQARQWAENKLSAEEYEAAFGPVQEDGSRSNVHMFLPTGLWEATKQEASRQGINVSELVESILRKNILFLFLWHGAHRDPAGAYFYLIPARHSP